LNKKTTNQNEQELEIAHDAIENLRGFRVKFYPFHIIFCLGSSKAKAGFYHIHGFPSFKQKRAS
jgi:hypothetical protein